MQKRKTYKPWVILLALPWIIFPVMIIGSLATRNIGSCSSSTSSTSLSSGPGLQPIDAPPVQECRTSPAKQIINIVLLLLGVGAVISILAAPVWIVMLIRAQEYNRKLAVAPQQTPLPPQYPTQPQ
ncbi:MAG: hypothetical protein ABIQ89_00215 [Candidatus Saccharimonadales bacterium]